MAHSWHWLPLTKWVRFLTLLGASILFSPAYGYPPLQLYVEITPAGGVLRPPPGTYAGPVVVTKPMTIDGEGKVTIDGGGTGSVLTVEADGATIRGLHLTNSGNSHDQVDAGILLSANNGRIEDNVIDDSLFGIHMRQASGNIIRANRISSRPAESSMRGDGLRVWNSNQNLIEENEIFNARDIFFTNSSDNRIIKNRVHDGRVGMEFVFANGNLVEGNELRGNETGIVILYSTKLTIRNNQISHAHAAAGTALALKESSEVLIEGNQVLHCTIGVQVNAPTQPEYAIRLIGNRFAYNDIATYFYGEKGGHVLHDNRFEQNMVQVAVSAATSAIGHDWRGNYWDDYAGFDRNGDGIGDTPYEIYLYTDRIWMDRPMARFFRGSPALEAIDFVERLAPFSQPPLILRDPSPHVLQRTSSLSGRAMPGQKETKTIE